MSGRPVSEREDERLVESSLSHFKITSFVNYFHRSLCVMKALAVGSRKQRYSRQSPNAGWLLCQRLRRWHKKHPALTAVVYFWGQKTAGILQMGMQVLSSNLPDDGKDCVVNVKSLCRGSPLPRLIWTGKSWEMPNTDVLETWRKREK